MNKEEIIILCEGASDIAFLSLYLIQKYKLKFDEDNITIGKKKFAPTSLNKEFYGWYYNDNYEILICSVGGSGRKFNTFFSKHIKGYIDNNVEDKISLIVITDSDNKNISEIEKNMNFEKVKFSNNTLINNSCKNGFEQNITIISYLSIIPKNKSGALENILIDSIKNTNEYFVDISTTFVDKIKESEIPIRSKNRYKLKAKTGVILTLINPEHTFFALREKFKVINIKADCITDNFKFLDLFIKK